MQVNWASDDDSPDVKQLLRGYGDRPENERRNLIDQLALLGADQALRPLCRLVRYEASEKLSKHAALLRHGAGGAGRGSRAAGTWSQTLQTRMGKSQRDGRRLAAGLRRCCSTTIRPPPPSGRHCVDQEQTRLVDAPDQTSREITRDLLKWFADQLTRRNQPEAALAVMRNMTSLLNSTPQEVLDAVDWFRDRQSWAIVVEIAAQFPETFKRSPLLLYRLAETYRQLGDQAEGGRGGASKRWRPRPTKRKTIWNWRASCNTTDCSIRPKREYRHVAQDDGERSAGGDPRETVPVGNAPRPAQGSGGR